MAEQIQIDFSKLENTTSVIPTEEPTSVAPIKEEGIKKEELKIDVPQIDFSKLEGTTSIKETDVPQIDFSKLEGVSPQFKTPKKTKKYSNAALIRYGIDKQNTFFGNAYRVVKAGTQAAFDPEKDFKDYKTILFLSLPCP